MSICVTCKNNVKGIFKADKSCKKGLMLPSGLAYCNPCLHRKIFDWLDVEYLREHGFWCLAWKDKWRLYWQLQYERRIGDENMTRFRESIDKVNRKNLDSILKKKRYDSVLYIGVGQGNV